MDVFKLMHQGVPGEREEGREVATGKREKEIGSDESVGNACIDRQYTYFKLTPKSGPALSP